VVVPSAIVTVAAQATDRRSDRANPAEGVPAVAVIATTEISYVTVQNVSTLTNLKL
jgi:hypothetical protein